MQFKKKLIHTLIAGSAGFALSGNALANDSSELEELRGLVQDLNQKVKVLERKNENTE